MLTLLLGGARSGKSSLAVAIAARSGRPVSFIATGVARDAEFAERIARHRAERPPEWHTTEVPLEIEAALAALPAEVTVVLDCLTLWVANLADEGADDTAIVERATALASLARGRPAPTVVVSNEVGSGIVPADAYSRRYRDALGRVNSAVADASDDAYLVVAGRVLALYDLDTAPARPTRSPS
ncbi:MAG TPA: bifunctional adenosylcobinamide kinase/adenosylcobinamide-phosphate guanylyltransferase [Acidimicrobiales bacterium]|nr:bifunctional adenosylcobinamide kinase/adenosylcobinamide-phosphate guanylyltransferase [Acidimicrobiales bacterium]